MPRLKRKTVRGGERKEKGVRDVFSGVRNFKAERGNAKLSAFSGGPVAGNCSFGYPECHLAWNTLV